MYTDSKTTFTYLIVVFAFIYTICIENVDLVNIVVFPLTIMWAILKTNSKELVKDLVDVLKQKWSK